MFLIPIEVTSVSDKQVVSVMWPTEILEAKESRVAFVDGKSENELSNCSIEYLETDRKNNEIRFALISDKVYEFSLKLGVTNGFVVVQNTGSSLSIKFGSHESSLAEWF